LQRVGDTARARSPPGGPPHGTQARKNTETNKNADTPHPEQPTVTADKRGQTIQDEEGGKQENLELARGGMSKT